MRIATHTATEALNRAVVNNKNDLHLQQLRVATGQRYQLRSEQPADAADATRLQQAAATTEQWTRNIATTQTWERATEARLSSITNLVHRTREIAVSSSDVAESDTARQALADELNGILEDLVGHANAKHNGVALFGGADSAPPVSATRSADGEITAVTHSPNSAAPRSVQIDSETVMRHGATATGPNGVFADSATGRDLLQNVIDMRDSLRSGTAIGDTSLDELSGSVDAVTGALAQTGLRQNRLQSVEQHHQATEVNRQNRLSDLRDTDMAEAIGRLSELQASLEASMRMAASVGQLSLSKFI